MTLNEWLKNCSGIDQGRDLPRDYLESLYNDVITNELKMETSASYKAASKKGYLTKQGGRIKTWKQRWFVVADNCLYYFKNDKGLLSFVLVFEYEFIVLCFGHRIHRQGAVGHYSVGKCRRASVQEEKILLRAVAVGQQHDEGQRAFVA